jgi:predicted acyltransferase (DUF342 family)
MLAATQPKPKMRRRSQGQLEGGSSGTGGGIWGAIHIHMGNGTLVTEQMPCPLGTALPMAFDKRALVLPAGTRFEERTVVGKGDFILGNHVRSEFGLRTDGRIFGGQGAEITGNIDAEGEVRLDQSTHVEGDVSSQGNIYLGERCFIKGDLSLEGDLDVGDDVRIGGQLKAKGWVNKRNPIPMVVYVLLYLLELLRLGKSEEVDKILKELEDADDVEIAVDEVFMFIPDGSTLGLQKSDIKGGLHAGEDCRILGNFHVKGDGFMGDRSVLYGALRVEGDLELRPDSEVQGSIKATGKVTVGEGCNVLGDLEADTVEMYQSATVDGQIKAAQGVKFRTEAQERVKQAAQEKADELQEGKAADLVDLLG